MKLWRTHCVLTPITELFLEIISFYKFIGVLASVAPLVGASSHTPLSWGLESWSGHIPRLQVDLCSGCTWEAADRCSSLTMMSVSLFLSLSLSFSPPPPPPPSLLLSFLLSLKSVKIYIF